MNEKCKKNHFKTSIFVNKSEKFKEKKIFFENYFVVFENVRTFAPASLKISMIFALHLI